MIARVLSTDVLSSPTPGLKKQVNARKGAIHNLEAALFARICDRANKNCVITGPIFTAMLWLRWPCNAKIASEDLLKLVFSGSWIKNFKKRWGFCSFTCHVESGDPDMSTIVDNLPALRAKVSFYSPIDVLNPEKRGLFYKLAPERAVALSRSKGQKQAKNRISILVCANADGSDKVETPFIGTSFEPWVFKKKSAHDYGLEYRSIRCAWMTTQVFFEWLSEFNCRMKAARRKILLLIDNCSAHCKSDTVPNLKSVEVVYLPPNPTSKFSRSEAGIIAALKCCYRRFRMERAVDLYEGVIPDIYQKDLLTEQNCFKLSKIGRNCLCQW